MDVVKLRGVASQQLYKYKLIGWKFSLMDTGQRLGVCKSDLKYIGISEHYARNSPEENVMDTLMHEIAHALVGPGHGHGEVWKAMARKLGATPRACNRDSDTVQKPGDWKAECSTCHKVYFKYRRPQCLTGFRCGKCKTALKFAYAGNPALKPIEPAIEWWEATCPGCKTIHRKPRKPKAGRYRCKCVHSSQLPPWKQMMTPFTIGR